jgi:hypothetical protein
VRTFAGHTNEKNFVGLTSNGDYITCGSENSSVYTYYKALSKPILSYKLHTANPVTVRWPAMVRKTRPPRLSFCFWGTAG